MNQCKECNLGANCDCINNIRDCLIGEDSVEVVYGKAVIRMDVYGNYISHFIPQKLLPEYSKTWCRIKKLVKELKRDEEWVKVGTVFRELDTLDEIVSLIPEYSDIIHYYGCYPPRPPQ